MKVLKAVFKALKGCAPQLGRPLYEAGTEWLFEVRFRDGHVELVEADTAIGAQFASSSWSDVSSVGPLGARL